MKCYELPDGENQPENENELQLLIAAESDSDTEPCTTDDELSGDAKSSSDEESEKENENEKWDGIVLYLSKPGTSYWDVDNDNDNSTHCYWDSLPYIAPSPPDLHWSQLAAPRINVGPDHSHRGCLSQYAPSRVFLDQDSPPRNLLSQYAPSRVYLDEDSPPRDSLSQYSLPRFQLDHDSVDINELNLFNANVSFALGSSRDRSSQHAPPPVYLSQYALPGTNLGQDTTSPQDITPTTLPRPLFHDMIYNPDQFMARQNNPIYLRNFVSASSVYQSYLADTEEADNERLAANAARSPQDPQ